MSLLTVSDLRVSYAGAGAPAVDNVGFTIERGEAVGLVGESGSGKTQSALAMMGLLPANALVSGSIQISGQEIIGAGDKQLRTLRARKAAMIFQDPRLSLNPYISVGSQLKRIIFEHRITERRDARARVMQMLETVGLPDPARQYRCFPHQLSGGMRQRVMIAAALMGDPDLLIADEPTTALDVTIQAQILHLLQKLRQDLDKALLLITHDLGVIAGYSERMLVMERGRLVEEGTTQSVFAAPYHPATMDMLRAASPHPPAELPEQDRETVLQADDIAVSFPQRVGSRSKIHAVLPLTLQVRRAETVAIVGESGSGKTSLVRAILGLLPMRGGRVSYLGKRLKESVRARPRDILRHLQMVFQDPLASLNPAMKVGAIVAEPLRIHEPRLNAAQRRDTSREMLVKVGLDATLIDRFPHELSGGQAQRVAIARALVVKPSILVCDEAVAALDMAVKRDILSLLANEQAKSSLSIVFISHDLSIVREISHRAIVMYMGRAVETAATTELFARPRHPYTRALIDAIPVPDPTIVCDAPELAGEVSSLSDPPPGCVFHPRCAFAVQACAQQVPSLSGDSAAQVACHRATELDLS